MSQNKSQSKLGFYYDVLRLREYFGIKGLVWIFVLFGLVLVYPSFLLGQTIANYYYNATDPELYYFEENKVLAPEYLVSHTQVLPLSNGERELYVQISNAINKDVGYYPWVYTKQVVDKLGKVIEETTVTDYLLAGGEKFIIYTSKDANADSLNIVTNKEKSVAMKYNPNNAKYLDSPNVSVVNKKFTDSQYDKKFLDIALNIQNESKDIAIKNLSVIIFLRGGNQNPVGIATLLIPKLSAGEVKEVSLKNYPKPNEGSVEILDVRFQFNYMEEDSLTLN